MQDAIDKCQNMNKKGGFLRVFNLTFNFKLDKCLNLLCGYVGRV